jgi:hypothetical protein
MGSIRRKLGAFAVATAMAAMIVMMPARIEAKGKTGSIDAFCAQLQSAVDYVASLESNLVTDALLAQLEATYASYCGSN